MDSVDFLQLKLFLKVFQNLNVIAHLVVPVGWGSCLPRLAGSVEAKQGPTCADKGSTAKTIETNQTNLL